MDERSAFDPSPHTSRASGQLFFRVRRLAMAGLVFAVVIATLIPG